MAKSKDGEIMAKKLSDFEKVVNYIKRIINIEKSKEIPNEVLDDLRISLGFTISKAEIKEKVKEQEITYTDVVVDSDFFRKYLFKHKKVIQQTLDNCSINFTSDIQKFKFIYTSVIRMIHEEYEEDNFTNIYMKEKFTQKTKISWDSLVRYVKYNVFKYDVEQRLSNNSVLKLQELSYGRIMGNKNQCSTCHYTFDEILLTFKYCYFEIEKATMYKSFDSENQKMNYICAIIKSNINDVIKKVSDTNRATEKLLNSDLSNLTSKRANYVRRTEECLPELEHLW